MKNIFIDGRQYWVMRDNHFEEDEQIISRETIEKSIDCGEAYRILDDGKPVGGVIVKIDGDKGDLEIFILCESLRIPYCGVLQQPSPGS